MVCPYCCTSVQVRITAVTRSRNCTHCGRLVMLQVHSRGGLLRLRAQLLSLQVSEPAPPDASTPHELANLNAAKADASDRQAQRHLLYGAVLCLMVITLLISMHHCSRQAQDGGSPSQARRQVHDQAHR